MHRLTDLPERIGSAHLERTDWSAFYQYRHKLPETSLDLLLARIIVTRPDGFYRVEAQLMRDLDWSMIKVERVEVYGRHGHLQDVPGMLQEAHQSLKFATAKWSLQFGALRDMVHEQVDPAPSLWDRLDGS